MRYQAHRAQYFAGFVPGEDILHAYPGAVLEGLWDRIAEAAIDGINEEMESFIWAGAEIRRDSWTPPPMRWKAKASVLRETDVKGGQDD